MFKKCTALWHEAHVQVKMCKSLRSGELLEVEMLEKCAALWREAHFEVKTAKNCVRFEALSVQKVHAVVARSTFPNQNVKTLHVRSIFGRSLVILCGRRKEFSTFQN